MNLHSCLALALLAAAALPLAAAPAGELLENPEFTASADGRVAAGWHDESSALPLPAGLRVLGGGAQRGQRVTLGPLHGGRFRLVQTMPAPAPGFYRLRATFRAANPVQVELVARTAARPWIVFGNVRQTLGANMTQEVVGYARIPADAGPVDFVILVDDPGTVDLTAASLRAVAETTLSPAELTQVERVLGPPLPEVDERRLLADTDARIRANRTAPLSVHVVNADGRPAAGVVVHVEQIRHRFWFGAGFDWGLLPHENETAVDRRQREAFLRLFNAATVPIYSENYEAAPGRYQDNAVLRAVQWLDAHSLKVRVAPLYWNLTVPDWLGAAAPTADAARQWMDRLLAHASAAFVPQVDAVEVFNEAVNWDRYATPLTPVLAGDRKAAVMADFLRRFKGLNPGVEAMVNDYDSTPEYYHLLRSVIDDGGPLDAIGLQTHMQNGAWSVTQLWNVLNRLALLQRPIYLTELSVISGAPRDFNFRPADLPWPTTPAGEAAQARYLELFYRLAYSNPAVAGITYWSYADRSAWLGCPVGLLRPDGSPKPAFWALDRLINQAWHTWGDYRTDADGRIVLPHAFEGEYRISAAGYSVEGAHSVNRPLAAALMIGR